MPEIDFTKNVYLFTHGRIDLQSKAEDLLIEKGFAKDKITVGLPDKVGAPGEYMAMLWMPPNPDHIKIQLITEVKQVEPQGMMGLWAGVSKDDIDSILLD